MQRRGATPALVGRKTELARLRALLDEAAAGRPAVGLLGGDAGIGKTRLLDELGADAADRGFLVLWGQCVELGGGGLPYLPFVDALRNASVEPASAETMTRAVAERPALARLVSLGSITEDAGEDSGQLPLFSAVLSVFSQLATQAPVLLILEDLHWADRSTRDLLSFLSRTLRQESVAIVASYRSDDLHRRHALRPVLTELARVPGVERIDLPPLDDREMAQLLAERSEAPVPEATLATLLVRAEGNAFFAEELLAASADCITDVPGELADVLLGRVEQLAAPAQHALRVASVAGRRVDHRLLAEAAGLDEAALDEALREAVSRQLLSTDAASGYVFRHALLQEAIYSDLLPGERTRLHGVYVQLLSRPDQPWGRGSAADLAYHSLAGHDLAAALQALDRAAAEADAVAAPAEALRHLEEALSLWDRVPDAEALVGQPRWRLGMRAAAAASGSGEYARAVALARAAAATVDVTEQPLVMAEIYERLTYFLLEISGNDDAAELGAESVRLVPAEPPTKLRATVTAGHARTLLNVDRYAESGVMAQEALACARLTGSMADEAEALTTLAMLAERSGDQARCEALLLESREVAQRSGDAAVQLRVLHNLVSSPLDRGELGLALRRAQEGLAFAERHGLALSGWGLQLRHHMYNCYFMRGEWDAAAELTSHSDRVSGVTSAFIVTFGAQHMVARGDARAFGQLARVQPFWSEDVLLAHLAGCLGVELAIWQGDHDRARELNRSAMDILAAGWSPTTLALVRHSALGLAAEANRAALGRAIADQRAVGSALEVGEELFAWGTRSITEGQARAGTPGVEARAWYARAVAERSRLTGENDPELWQAAVDGFSFGLESDVYETARGRWRLSEALMLAGRRDEAVLQWRLAAEVAERLGAAPLLQGLEDLRRRARLATAAPQTGAGAGGATSLAAGGGSPGLPVAVPDGGLTPRELEVLRLVAEGRTNRQIGAVLFITDKTASVHVSNLMAKLGAASRTEAAALAYREGLLELPS
jgi:DNA-binding CsgD family transcriptional regulator/tetratricopeptide (TPR) repeat protein